MKIAHLLCYMNPSGGIIRSAGATSEYFISAGHQVDWIHWWIDSHSGASVPPGVNIKRPWIAGFPGNGPVGNFIGKIALRHIRHGWIFLCSPFTAHQLKNKLLKHERYDVIFVHRPLYLGLCTLREPHVVVIHNSLDKEFIAGKKRLGKLFWQKIWSEMLRNKFVLTVSEALKKDVQENYKKGESENKTFCAYNPIDVERITRLARRAPEHPPPERYIVASGRLVRQKRFDLLIRAYARSGIGEDLVILGDGKEKDRLKEAAELAGVRRKVHFPGFQSNPYPWIHKARLFVLSSDYEGMPTALLEALALGVAVVSTDCPTGPREILNGPMQKYLVPPGDEEALAGRIRKTLEENPVVDPAVVDRFRPEVAAERWLEKAGEIIEARRRQE